MWERAENRAHQQDVNLLNNPAAITPVTDGENVYVFFKDFGLISYDAAGKLRWKVPLGPFTNSMGMGASPIVAGDSIILVADQINNSYIAAFDRRNGEIRWKTARQESEGWGTPLLYTPQGSAAFDSDRRPGPIRRPSRRRREAGIQPPRPQPWHGRQSGARSRHHLRVRLWSRSRAGPFRAVCSLKLDKNHDGQLTPDEYQDIPGDTSDHQMTATLTGMGKYMGNGDGIVTQDKWDAWGRHTGGPTGLLAVRLDGDAPRDLWRYDKGFAGVIPSPLLYDGVLYVIKNGGILTAFNPATGEVLQDRPRCRRVGRILRVSGGRRRPDFRGQRRRKTDRPSSRPRLGGAGGERSRRRGVRDAGAFGGSDLCANRRSSLLLRCRPARHVARYVVMNEAARAADATRDRV